MATRRKDSPMGESAGAGVTVRRRKLADYVADPRNANRGTARGSGMLEHSVGTFGPARSGVADKDGVIRAGNHTAEQLYAAGIEDVIEIETTGRQWVVVRRTDMDARMGQEYALYDNRTGQLIDFDPSVLREFQVEGIDLTRLWTDTELSNLLNPPSAYLPTMQPDVVAHEVGDEDMAKEVTCPHCGQDFILNKKDAAHANPQTDAT